MASRRAFLAVPTLAGVAACTTTDPRRVAEESVMSGSVTDPTGSVKGVSVAGLVDAYAGNWSGIIDPVGTAMAQWQYVAMLSDKTGACSREGSGGAYAASEIVLQIALVGYREQPYSVPVFPPTADVPMTLQAGAELVRSDGVHVLVEPSVMQATRQGKAGNSTAATGGTVTFTRMDATLHEGLYDLMFGASRVTGGFSAPWCGQVP